MKGSVLEASRDTNYYLRWPFFDPFEPDRRDTSLDDFFLDDILHLQTRLSFQQQQCSFPPNLDEVTRFKKQWVEHTVHAAVLREEGAVRVGAGNSIEMSISESSRPAPCSAVIEHWDGSTEQQSRREKTFNHTKAEDNLAYERATKRWGFVGWQL